MTQMHPVDSLRSGGQILVDQLKIHGVDTVFCVPGESYINVLDALYAASDTIRLSPADRKAGPLLRLRPMAS